MKIRICGLLVAAFLAASCSRKPVQPEFGEIVIDTLVGSQLIDNKVEYRFATILNTKKSDVLKHIEQSNINYFFELEQFAGTAGEAADSALRQIVALTAMPATLAGRPAVKPAWGPAEFTVEAEGMVQDTLLNYIISRTSYTGGAHGMYSTECHTYSLCSGSELSTSDLFDEAQRGRLNEQIRQTLYERYNAHNDDELAAQGFFTDYIEINENFQITADSITFFYNPYEIGCHALGAIEVTLPREKTPEKKQQ